MLPWATEHPGPSTSEAPLEGCLCGPAQCITVQRSASPSIHVCVCAPHASAEHPDPNTSEAHLEVWLQQVSKRWSEVPHMAEAIKKVSRTLGGFRILRLITVEFGGAGRSVVSQGRCARCCTQHRSLNTACRPVG